MRPVWEHRTLFSRCPLMASVMDYHHCMPGLRATKVTEPMMLLQEQWRTAWEPYGVVGKAMATSLGLWEVPTSMRSINIFFPPKINHIHKQIWFS